MGVVVERLAGRAAALLAPAGGLEPASAALTTLRTSTLRGALRGTGLVALTVEVEFAALTRRPAIAQRSSRTRTR